MTSHLTDKADERAYLKQIGAAYRAFTRRHDPAMAANPR
jgi:hypothetical protein